MAERLTDTLVPWFAEAFQAHSLGERVTWDLILGVGADPNGCQIPMLLVHASIPAATLGEVHPLFAQVRGLGLTEEAVGEVVRTLLDKLFEIRTQAMFQHNGSAAAMPWPPKG